MKPLSQMQSGNSETSAGQAVIPDQSAEEFRSRDLYFRLLNESANEQTLAKSRSYLVEQLQAADRVQCDVPGSIGEVASWIGDSAAQVQQQYHEYLEARKAGAGRRYFSNKAHAFYFLQSVAPTKMVDGAWLYGLVRHWNDSRFSSLIKIYLEELGEGVPDKNHVTMYKKLLAVHGCEQWHDLTDGHYIQGAIQLSLAHHAEDFLPEVIGFNLGYEQPPLHLLITAYELNELGINAKYFTLHYTIDNAHTGHAKKSLDGLLDSLPRVDDPEVFFQRVMRGCKLNWLGICSTSVIASFNLHQELIDLLKKKSVFGKQVHSNYCRVGGQTVNEWLSDPTRIPAFLGNLERIGWIKRGQDPQHSRFWNLIHGNSADMFGVFNQYEKQVIYDWIAGEAKHADEASPIDGKLSVGTLPKHRMTFRASQRNLDSSGEHTGQISDGTATGDIDLAHAQADDFNHELRMLEDKVATLSGKNEVIKLLITLMSPSNHHTEVGLMATRIYTRMVSGTYSG